MLKLIWNMAFIYHIIKEAMLLLNMLCKCLLLLNYIFTNV